MPYGDTDFISEKFTEYPSQAGYFFQWNLGAAPHHRAFHPVNPTGSITGYPTYLSGAWNIALEPFPIGYRHPNDAQGNVVNSEFRQSLYATPANDAHTVISNSVHGFYADGFFDRLSVTASACGIASSAVSFFPSPNLHAIENTKVAYTGMIIYNPTTFASIFLPAAGYRAGNQAGQGFLFESGNMVAYYTSTLGLAFGASSTHTLFGQIASNGAAGVRCVKFDFGLPGSPDFEP
jgi:hypothetical protein